jgi:hypothetical protein
MKVPRPQVLAKAVNELYRRRFLDECNGAYARLKLNKRAWDQVLAERNVWDTTLCDGLQNLGRGE